MHPPLIYLGVPGLCHVVPDVTAVPVLGWAEMDHTWLLPKANTDPPALPTSFQEAKKKQGLV